MDFLMPVIENPAVDGLLAEAEAANQIAVAIRVRALEMVKQTTTPAHHFQEALTGVVIMNVCLEMIGKGLDACGK
jgi:folate-dependent tRNA-U54 methylase TrmFO/GidA